MTHATSNGHTSLVDSGCHHGNLKPMNFNSAIVITNFINYSQVRIGLQDCPTLINDCCLGSDSYTGNVWINLQAIIVELSMTNYHKSKKYRFSSKSMEELLL